MPTFASDLPEPPKEVAREQARCQVVDHMEVVEKEVVEKEVVEKEVGEKEAVEKEIVEKEVVEKQENANTTDVETSEDTCAVVHSKNSDDGDSTSTSSKSTSDRSPVDSANVTPPLTEEAREGDEMCQDEAVDGSTHKDSEGKEVEGDVTVRKCAVKVCVEGVADVQSGA
jgi:hypothetical protein